MSGHARFPCTGAVSQRIPQKVGTGEIGWSAPEIDLLVAARLAFADLPVSVTAILPPVLNTARRHMIGIW